MSALSIATGSHSFLMGMTLKFWTFLSQQITLKYSWFYIDSQVLEMLMKLTS